MPWHNNVALIHICDETQNQGFEKPFLQTEAGARQQEVGTTDGKVL